MVDLSLMKTRYFIVLILHLLLVMKIIKIIFKKVPFFFFSHQKVRWLFQVNHLESFYKQ